MRSAKSEIRHSLFSGNRPPTNEAREERILLRHFEATWTPFLLLQVRAIITTFLSDHESTNEAEAFRDLLRSKGNEDSLLFPPR